jgi:hypothetical protein
MLNFNKKGKPIAIIQGGKYNGEKLFISDDLEDTRGFQNVDLSKVDIGGKFQPIEDPKADRTVSYITGPSGSGKSFYIGKYISELKKMKKRKDTPIYLISPFEEDKSLDKMEPLRLNVSDICENPIRWNDFDKGSIIIFDDMDVFAKNIRDELYELLEHLLKGGRHNNNDIIVTQHDPTGRHLQTLLNESHTVTIFPYSGAVRKLLYLCEQYIGLDKKDFAKIKRTKSRWATIGKNYPQYVVTEKHAFTLSNDIDDVK